MRKSLTLRTTPLVVWVSIVTWLAAVIWIDVFEQENSHLTIDSDQSWSGILIGAAAIAGTILGIRFLWGLYCFFAGVAAAFSLTGLVQDGWLTQLVGGSVFSVASLVLILLPSVVRFENKRLRLMVEDPDDPDNARPVPWELLLLALALVALLSVLTASD